MVEFAGWDMPLHFGSQVAEHRRVRSAAGMFDVSHMGIVDLVGPGGADLLRYLLANDIARLRPGKALYSCMLNPGGGVMDDLIVYALADGTFRIVVNAATCEKDLAWIRLQAHSRGVEVTPRCDLAMLAIQGPEARDKTVGVLPDSLRGSAGALRPFAAHAADRYLLARTGYTGEDGFEVMLPGDAAATLWQALEERGVQPCGLGARDSLRLEAGLCLYGAEMGEETSPLEAGLGWTVAWEPETRDFIGRSALEAIREAGPARGQVGLVLTGSGVLRSGQRVIIEGIGQGVVTSGGFAPTLGTSIALASVPEATPYEVPCQVEIRGKLCPAWVVKPPFVRHGKPMVQSPGVTL
jgi:glycine cleavage system T protein (aminomethyltransferase)